MKNLFKKIHMKNQPLRIILILFSFTIVWNANAQIKEIGSMLSGSTADAEKLLQAYLKPYANAFGADLNGGWYNTAKPHKLLGFDLTASVSVAFVPSADKTYDVSKLGLKGTITGNPSAPTVAGAKENGPTVSYYGTYNSTSVKIGEFKTPQGTNWGIIPAPMFQLGIGLVKETDITIRYVPDMNVGSFGSAGLWGIGLKHSIKQWIPGLKMAPFFNLSAFLGYTKMTTKANISFAPDFYVSNINATDLTTLPYDNQQMQMTFKGFTGNIVASFDLPVVTFYGAVGIASTTTNLALKGDYPMASIETTGANAGKAVVKDGSKLTDPLNIKMSGSSGSVTKPRLNAGIKFKMAIITLHFDYTLANYSVVTAGLGISFR
jgi:hypothetical protein